MWNMGLRSSGGVKVGENGLTPRITQLSDPAGAPDCESRSRRKGFRAGRPARGVPLGTLPYSALYSEAYGRRVAYAESGNLWLTTFCAQVTSSAHDAPLVSAFGNAAWRSPRLL